jgi:hypothetical protein
MRLAFQFLIIWIVVVFLGVLVSNLAADPSGSAGAAPHNYVFFGRNRERIAEESFLDTKAFEGAQIRYAWKEIEHGPDGYDFSDIEHDLAFLNAHGKKLFIQIQDISYDMSIVPLPRYLLENPEFHGGAATQFNIEGDHEERAKPEGWVAMRWDPAVEDRFQKLLLALGKEFDGRIEGINLAETALDFGESGRLFPKGFTPALYRDAVIADMQVLKRAFPKSVAMVYANFMVGGPPGAKAGSYLRDVYAKANELGVAMGGPDLKPYRPAQMANSYPLLREIAVSVPTGIAIQDGNYTLANPKTGKPVTIPELVGFATEYLGVKYIFWCTQQPFYDRDVVPYFRGLN